MKEDVIIQLAASLSKEDFKAIETHLAYLDNYLTLRTYIEGYTFSSHDSILWIAIRGNKVTHALIKKAKLIHLTHWFTFVEQSHPELQEEAIAKNNAEKAKKAALSKAGASYNIALQDAEMGKAVTRSPPAPS